MENEKDPVQWLQDVVRINTINANETEVALYIKNLLDEAGIESELVEYAPGRDNLIATMKKGDSNKVLGLSGHMDVVPLGDKPWSYEPFGGEEINGKIYGRGASDMKSGLMTMVAAMINIKKNDVPFNGTIKLLATVAEEVGLLGSEELTKQGYADDLTALAISEPTLNVPFAYYKGVLRIRLTTTGRTANSGNPEDGVNAVEHMRYYLKRYQQEIAPSIPNYNEPQLGSATISLNVVNGGTDINLVPDQCIAEIEVRTVPALHERKEELLAEFQALADRIAQEVEHFQIAIEYFVDNAPVNTSYTDPFVLLAATAARRPVSPIGLPGCTDGSSFTKAGDFPIVIMGCGRGAHYTDEYAPVSTYQSGIAVYERLIKSYLK